MAAALPTNNRGADIPFFTSSHGTVYYHPTRPGDSVDSDRDNSSLPRFPTPLISPRRRRPHSIHILSFPRHYVPSELRGEATQGQPERRPSRRKSKKKRRQEKARELLTGPAAADQGRGQELQGARREEAQGNRLLLAVIAAFGSCWSKSASSNLTRGILPLSGERIAHRQLQAAGSNTTDARGSMTQTSTMTAIPPTLLNSNFLAAAPNAARSSKAMVTSSVTDLVRPVASGSGLSCSIVLAEPTVFLTGFEHDGQTHTSSHSSSSLLRGKLQLNVSKNVKLKSVTLRLIGKARTEWPEGIPPTKVDMSEEESLRTQVLTFFHAMHDGWETDYGNQCSFTLKKDGSPNGSSSNLSRLKGMSPSQSVVSLHLTNKNRQQSGLSAKELKRLSLQSAQSRSFGKGDSPMANAAQLKGFKVFYPGTYEYSFELPIDHHQLETTKLQYGSVRWELQTCVERAGAFKPNLNGSREVRIVRLPDQMSLEMTEPISISRQWEDQLHYDIMISGKSFPIGAKIPIAFKLMPLAKVHIHKIKVFVTESAEYWTNDRRVTRKDPGRKLLLLEKVAGKPLDKQYGASEVRVLNGGELSQEERAEARAAAVRRRSMAAHLTNATPDPLPEPSENLLGDLDLGLETYWGSTEMEMNVQLPTCEMMAKDKLLRLHPDCSWKNVNVFHWIKIVMRISRLDPADPTGRHRRHFEISIDSPFTVLDCRATQANTALPEYTCPTSAENQNARQQRSCGCPDALRKTTAASNGILPLSESTGPRGRSYSATPTASLAVTSAFSSTALPERPQAAHIHTVIPRSTDSPAMGSSADPSSSSRPALSSSPVHRTWEQDSSGSRPQNTILPDSYQNPRPIHLLRVPSYNPPAFDADDPPPPLPQDLLTPPPLYDIIVGTPSVDGLADYFQRLAHYDSPEPTIAETEAEHGEGEGGAGHSPTEAGTEVEEDDSDSAEEDAGGPARIAERSGRVNVANPRTPGGRLVPSRSLEIERPAFNLSMAGVVRRGE